MSSLTTAFYSHPAFLPHRALAAIGISRFGVQNTIVTCGAAIGLTLSAWCDGALRIAPGYGYLEHPGIFGWYLIQLAFPLAVYRVLQKTANSREHYRQIVTKEAHFNFKRGVFQRMVNFISVRTDRSRAVLGMLAVLGLTAFAWNTFQNLHPGELAPLDFWDSKNYRWGYFGTRIYKFYTHALLLPSSIHIFAGVVWAHLSEIRALRMTKAIKIAPFHPDRCGGFGFLADLILSPTITAVLISGLAFFGVVYTQRSFSVTVAIGLLAQSSIVVLFYIMPTFALRSVITDLKKQAIREVHTRQEAYYETILSGRLKGVSIRDAHEYLRYFRDISAQIERIPNWPHLAKVSGAFGISISPALIVSIANLGSALLRFPPDPP